MLDCGLDLPLGTKFRLVSAVDSEHPVTWVQVTEVNEADREPRDSKTLCEKNCHFYKYCIWRFKSRYTSDVREVTPICSRHFRADGKDVFFKVC